MSFFKKIFFKIEILFLCHLLVRTTTQPHNNPHDNTPGQQQTRTTTHPHNNMPTYHKQQPVRCRYLMTPVCSANGAASLNRNGFVVSSLLQNPTDFVQRTMVCAQNWFQHNLEKMLSSPPDKLTANNPPLLASMAAWVNLSDERKRFYMRSVDLTTPRGMQLVFVSTFMATQEWWKNMPGNEFFRKAVVYVKQGNVGMALANMAGAWTAKGFGLWAHLVPEFGIALLEEGVHFLKSLGIEPGCPQHFPHLICKPPGGSALEIHHDQVSPLDLLSKLRLHVESADPSTLAWVKANGLQMLAHLRGGTSIGNGATFVIGPMDPTILLVCLEAYASGAVGGKYKEWLAKDCGKADLDWRLHMDAFNSILARRGCASIGILPAVADSTPAARSTLCTAEHTEHTGFLLAFPVGFPHGSFGNSNDEDQAHQKGSRVSMTMPITVRESSQLPDERIPDRLRHMATLSSGGQSTDAYTGAESWLLRDTTTYADGLTHKKPQKVVDLIRHPDAPGPTGHFHAIAVKQESVAKYVSGLRSDTGPRELPSRACGPMEEESQQASVVKRGRDETGGSDSDTLAPLHHPHWSATIVDDSFHVAAPSRDLPYPSCSSPDLLPPRGWRMPPTAKDLCDNTRLVKVKEPWASTLVSGIKNVENRTWKFKPVPAWVIVVSSKSMARRCTLSDLEGRLKLAGLMPSQQHRTDKGTYMHTRGKILGMVKVESFTKTPMPTHAIWHNPTDFAWVISDAWAFKDPIPLDEKDCWQTQVLLSTCLHYRARLVNEIGKLEAGYP